MAKYKMGKSVCFDSLDECIIENPLSFPVKKMSNIRLNKVLTHAINQNGRLLLEGQLSVNGKCFLSCSNGHVWAALPNNLTRSEKKSWCPHRECASLRILQSRDSIDMNLEVKRLCEIKGLAWLSGVYINQREKNLLCECIKCKERHFLSREQIKSTRFKCETCSAVEYHANTKELLKNAGVELISPCPLPIKKSRVKCKCLKCKRPWNPTLDAVITSSKNSTLYGCGLCENWYETDEDFINEAKPYIDSRQGRVIKVLKAGKAGKRYRVILISCQEAGHEAFTRTISELRRGVWCRDCSSPGQKELLTRSIMEHLLGQKFKKITPKLGAELIGEKLELDGYCSKFKVAFEHQGVQHYEYTPHFHRSLEEFNERLEADNRKRQACENMGITLIEVNDKLKVNTIEGEIRKILVNKRPELKLNAESFKIGDARYGRSQERKSYLATAKRVAVERGGACLSKEYISSSEDLEFKCLNDNHSSWPASYSSVVNLGTWCPECANEAVGFNNRVDLSTLALLCVDAGVSLLKKEKKVKDVVKYLVKYNGCEHEDYLSLQQIKSKRKCSECPNPERGGSQRLDIGWFRDYAQRKGGALISKYYMNNSCKMLFSCEKGHVWPASGANVRNNQSWCPECAGRKGYSIDIEEFLKKEEEDYLMKFTY